MMSNRFLALWLLAVLPLAAQPLQVAGPVSGLVFDSESAAIRPILGVPGAAHVGDALVDGLEWASVAPGGKSALAVKGGALYVLGGIDRASPTWTPVEGGLGRPELAAWNAGGSAAVLYWAAAGRLQVVDNSGAHAPISVEGRATALALDSSGERAVAGLEGGLYLFAGEGPPVLLARLIEPAGITIAGPDLFVADRASGQILEVRDFAGTPKALPLAEAGDPVGLALVRGRLLVASGSRKSLDVYDLASRTLAAQIDLEAEPTTLEPLGANLLLLSGRARGLDALMVVDTSRDPGVFFVPAGRGE